MHACFDVLFCRVCTQHVHSTHTPTPTHLVYNKHMCVLIHNIQWYLLWECLQRRWCWYHCLHHITQFNLHRRFCTRLTIDQHMTCFYGRLHTPTTDAAIKLLGKEGIEASLWGGWVNAADVGYMQQVICTCSVWRCGFQQNRCAPTITYGTLFPGGMVSGVMVNCIPGWSPGACMMGWMWKGG